jgi:hypothetical protein
MINHPYIGENLISLVGFFTNGGEISDHWCDVTISRLRPVDVGGSG